MKSFLRKWLGLTEDLDKLNGTQYEQHMRILELERHVSELDPLRDKHGRFTK